MLWMDVCCLQELRWRGQGAPFVGVKGRRYKLWWKEELCCGRVKEESQSDDGSDGA